MKKCKPPLKTGSKNCDLSANFGFCASIFPPLAIPRTISRNKKKEVNVTKRAI